MAASLYLSSDEYPAYGLPSATTADQVARASSLIDSFIHRPEGLVWMPDSTGKPCYMAALTPTGLALATASFEPGTKVEVPVAGIVLTDDMVGEVFIVDRADTGIVEACVVQAVNKTAGTLTFAVVENAHSAAATLHQGLVITEERSLPAQRSVTRVTRSPLVRILSGLGRYGYGRRSQQVAGAFNDYNLLPTIGTFGGPPQWIPFDVSQCSISHATGEVWLPAGMLLAYYSEARLHYVAGFSSSSIPWQIKQACANLIKAFNALPVTGNVKTYRAGDTSIERFQMSLIDEDMKNSLAQFVARSFY